MDESVRTTYIGIGCTSQGLNPLLELFSACPKNAGISFVVQQCSSSPENHLFQTLAKECRSFGLTVELAKHGSNFQENYILIIPSGFLAKIENGQVQLRAVKSGKQKDPRPKNSLFCSLAEEFGDKVAGILFSGTDSDGTLGLNSILEHGGIIFRQMNQSSRFFARSKKSIQGQVPDETLLPTEIIRKTLLTRDQRKQPEQELIATRERLHSVIKQQQATSKELKSAHEEIIAQNQELQAGNVVLSALNKELRIRNQDLGILNSALKDSDEKFRALTQSASDAIITCDGSGNILMWNRAAESIFGYSAPEATGMKLTAIMPDRFRMAHVAGMKRVVSGGEQRVVGRPVELEALRKDGSEFPIELSLSKWDLAGAVYFTAIIRDVSERVWARRLQMARVEISRIMLQSIGIDEVIDQTMLTLCQLMGYKVANFWAYDKSADSLVAKQTWSKSAEDAALIIEVNATHTIKKERGLPGLNWDSQAAWYRDIQSDPRFLRHDLFKKLDLQTAVAFPIGSGPDFFGLIEFFSSSVSQPQQNVLILLDDIGSYLNHFIRRKMAEETAANLFAEMEARIEERTRKLQLSDARHRFLADASLILSSSTDYIATLQHIADLCIPTIADWCVFDIFNENGKSEKVAVAHANKDKIQLAWKLINQFPPNPEALHGPIHVKKTGQSEFLFEITPKILAATAYNDEHHRILKELSLKSYVCVPLKVNGQNIGTITLIFSETDRHYSAEDIPFMEEVARRAAQAAERTRLLNEAQSANKAKDEFLATLSHELRTPMNVILGWVEILQNEPDEKTLSSALEMLERNSRIQIKLIDDLIDISRITAGKLPVELIPLRLDTIIKSVAMNSESAAHRKGIDLKISNLASDATILGDDIRLSQVLQNLINNSIKFTPHGGTITVTLTKTSQDALIKVSDTGIGIPADFLPHVFDAFRQEDGTTTRKYGGLGLGLGISRYLVQRQGGRIEVESQGRDHGASFTLILPLADPKLLVDGTAKKPATHSVNQVSSRPLEGFKILAVDDSADILYLLNRRLQKWGAQVAMASSANGALQELAQKSFDLILCDIGMPEQDGLSFIRTLRAKVAEPIHKVPAIALTAYARDEEVKAALDAGFEMHIAKPVTEAKLLDRILAVLGPSL